MTIARPIDSALRDQNLLGAALGDASSWSTWLVTLRAAAGLPLNEQQQQTFAAVAGNRGPPSHRVREVWCVVGRGGGKSRMAAACAVHTALLQQHQLAAGETGHVLVLSPTISQAKIVFGYCLGFIEQSPVLSQEIVSTTQSEIRLRSGVVIGTHPNSYRSVRGRTLLAVIADEISFWRDETSALPDVEAYRAILPSLIRTGGQLIGISTPYRKFGLLFQKHKDHFGIASDDVLVVQGSSTQFNPMLSEGDIARAMRDDPEAGVSEWQGEFRADIGAFLDDRDIDGCVDHDRPIELPPRPSIKYHAFCDPSGGRHDAFAIAIGHREGELTIIDALRGHHPPFDTKLVVNECAALCKEYGVREVVGDNYAAAWVETEFKAAGIRYLRSELPKGRLYVENLPAFTRRVVSLPDHPKLLRELRLLSGASTSAARTPWITVASARMILPMPCSAFSSVRKSPSSAFGSAPMPRLTGTGPFHHHQETRLDRNALAPPTTAAFPARTSNTKPWLVVVSLQMTATLLKTTPCSKAMREERVDHQKGETVMT